MITYLPPEKVLDNPEFIKIPLKPDSFGGVKMDQITHYTRIPSNNDDWDKVVYLRYIGVYNQRESIKNGFGGYVYILTNRHYPSKCKVGMTTSTPEKRLQQINSSGVVVDWELAYAFKCTRPYVFEQALHLKLDYCRSRNDREFFDIEPMEVIALIEQMSENFGPL
jgi:hypothetical protein